MSESLRQSPLDDRHRALGARMVPFAGWEMPVQYTGILEEHLQTRERAGLFDICHMGEFFVRGPGALADLERLLSCRVGSLEPGRCRYGMLCREDGGVLDDLIVFRTDEQEFLLVVNAATREKDAEWIRSHLSEGSKFRDDSDVIAKLDVQGPASRNVLGGLVGHEQLEGLGRFRFAELEIDGVTVLLSRTGYTGELGYELFFETNEAGRLWDVLLGFEQLRPVGLGARDTLRLEVCLPLYGHELSEERTPLEAGLGRFVDLEKDFIGGEAMRRRREEDEAAGGGQRLRAFLCRGRRAARDGFEVMANGKPVGTVTSGAFSPMLKQGIGMCYVDAAHAEPGQSIVLRQGKVEVEAEIVEGPFYKPGG